jgi:hypothetical protein
VKDSNGVLLGVLSIGMSVYLLYPRAKNQNSQYSQYSNVKSIIAGIAGFILGIYLIIEFL